MNKAIKTTMAALFALLARAAVADGTAEINVQPLFNTTWNQCSPYTDFGPVVTLQLNGNTYDNHMVNGCVDVAYSQVMKYWQWPEKLEEDVSYNHTANRTPGFIQVIPAGTTINWRDLLDEYVVGVTPTAKQKADLGVSQVFTTILTEMAFNNVMSGANQSRFPENPWYDYGVDGPNPADDSIPLATRMAAARESLKAGIPLLIGIPAPGSGVAHSVVGTGWKGKGDDDDQIYLNYGWGGYGYDGFVPFKTSGITSYIARHKPRPIVVIEPVPYHAGFPVEVEWHFPRKGYEESLSGFAVKAFEVTDETFAWTDDFTATDGVLRGDGVSVASLDGFASRGKVLRFSTDSDRDTCTWPTMVVGADAKLSFDYRSREVRKMEVAVELYEANRGWKTIFDVPLQDEIESGDGWASETLDLSAYADRAVAVRIRTTRPYGADNYKYQGDNGIQFDNVRITNVRRLATEPTATKSVGGSERAASFESGELTLGKLYMFLVEPHVEGGIVSRGTAAKIVSDEPDAVRFYGVGPAKTGGVTFEDDTLRECCLGVNQFAVYGSPTMTKLNVILSQQSLIKTIEVEDTIVPGTMIPSTSALDVTDTVSWKKLGNGKFLVTVDFTKCGPSLRFTRELVTLEGEDDLGNVTRKVIVLHFKKDGSEEPVSDAEVPDFGGTIPSDPEPDPTPDPEPDVPDDDTIGVAATDKDPGTDYTKSYGYEMYDDYWTARKRAMRQGKQLFVLSGAAWCSNCAFVKNYLKTLGEGFANQFVVYYADHDSTACQCFQGGLPQYGAADPRTVDAFTGTLNGSTRSWDLAWQTESNGIYAQDRGGYASARVDNVVNAGKVKSRYETPTNLVIRGLSTLGTGTAGRYELIALYADGVEMPVDYGVAWEIASGAGTVTDAGVDGRDMGELKIASGTVVIRATSSFYFTGTRTMTVACAPESEIESVEILTDEVNLEDDATPTIDAQATLSGGRKIPVSGFGVWTATFKERLPRTACPELEEDSYQALHPSITVDGASRLTYARGASDLLEVCDQKIVVTLTVNGKTASKEITVWGPTKVIASKWTMLSGGRQTVNGVVRLQCTELTYNYGGQIRKTADTYFASYATVLKSGVSTQTSYLRGLTVFVDNFNSDTTYSVDLKAQKVNGKYKGYTPELQTLSARAVDYTSLARGADRTDIAKGCVPDGFFKAFFPDRSDYAALAEEDFDGDGFKNWEEYVLGTDPTDKNDAFTLMQGYQHLTAPAANGETMQYKVMYAQRAGRVYYIDAKNAWGDGWTHVATVNLASMKANAVTTFTDLKAEFADGAKFFRVRAALNDHLYAYGDQAPVIEPNMLVANRGAVIDLSTSTSSSTSTSLLDLSSFDTDATDPGTVYVKVPADIAVGTALIRAPKAAKASLEACRPKDRDDLAFEVVADPSDADHLILRVKDPAAAPAIEGGAEKGELEVSEEKIVIMPAENVTEITVSHPGGKMVEIPPSVKKLGGVDDVEKIVIRSGDHDITKAMKFTSESGGFKIELDAEAKVTVRETKAGVEVEEEISVTPELAGDGDARPFDVQEGNLVFTVKSIPGLKYQVLESDSLDPNGFSPVGQPCEATGSRRELTVTRSNEKRRFYKIQVSR